MSTKSTLLCVFVISINILGILSFPTKQDWNHEYEKAKGRSWEYGTKIKHPPPKHGYHHKGHDFHSNAIHHKDDGKGWTHISDTGDKHKHQPISHHYEKPHIPEIHHELPQIHHKLPEISIKIPDVHITEHIPPVHTIPIHIPSHHYEPKAHYEPKHHYEPQHHYDPKHHYPSHYQPKKEEPKKDGFDGLDLNLDHIIDDIQKDLKKTNNYVS